MNLDYQLCNCIPTQEKHILIVNIVRFVIFQDGGWPHFEFWQSKISSRLGSRPLIYKLSKSKNRFRCTLIKQFCKYQSPFLSGNEITLTDQSTFLSGNEITLTDQSRFLNAVVSLFFPYICLNPTFQSFSSFNFVLVNIFRRHLPLIFSYANKHILLLINNDEAKMGISKYRLSNDCFYLKAAVSLQLNRIKDVRHVMWDWDTWCEIENRDVRLRQVMWDVRLRHVT